MTIEISREVAPGIRFSVVSDGFNGEGPSLVIPVDGLARFTPSELYDVLWKLVPLAKLASVESYADYLVMNCGDRLVPSWVMDEQKDKIDELLTYEGQGGRIDQAIQLVRKTQQRTRNRAAAKPKRAEIASNYNNLFMSIGRRDGFCCVQCSSSHDLVIDHVVALINGGGNEMDNLQLLCSACNAKKSDK